MKKPIDLKTPGGRLRYYINIVWGMRINKFVHTVLKMGEPSTIYAYCKAPDEEGFREISYDKLSEMREKIPDFPSEWILEGKGDIPTRQNVSEKKQITTNFNNDSERILELKDHLKSLKEQLEALKVDKERLIKDKEYLQTCLDKLKDLGGLSDLGKVSNSP